VQTPHDEWVQRQSDLLSGESWIVDGTYFHTLDLRFERADTVILIEISPWRCL
jgi:adenylate kinase family enzyme